MDMTLYRAVGNLNRVALGALSTSEFYAASVDPQTKIITLHPVNIVDGTTKRTETADIAGGVYPTLPGTEATDTNHGDDVPFGTDNA